MSVAMQVDGVYYDPNEKSPVVILKDAEGGMRLPIWVGALEAMAILVALEKPASATRPLTHDLTAELIRMLGASVVKVDVTQVVEGVFHAAVHLSTPAGLTLIADARPSDAIALALRFGAPILAEQSVLDEAGVPVGSPGADDEYWKKFLEGLDPKAFGKYQM